MYKYRPPKRKIQPRPLSPRTIRAINSYVSGLYPKYTTHTTYSKYKTTSKKNI